MIEAVTVVWFLVASAFFCLFASIAISMEKMSKAFERYINMAESLIKTEDYDER